MSKLTIKKGETSITDIYADILRTDVSTSWVESAQELKEWKEWKTIMTERAIRNCVDFCNEKYARPVQWT